MNKLAVIPARSGSTRLKDKNICPINGKPLIRWITQSVIESRCFDDIVISTDSDYIFDQVKDLNVTRHIRPKDLATSQATVLQAMIDLMLHTNREYEIFAYFLPTCPFVSPDDIIMGIDRLKDCDTVVSMTEMQDTLQLACLIEHGRILPMYDNIEHGLTNSRLIKKYYKPSGAFYMGKWKHIIEHRNFFKGKAEAVLIPPERSVDINTIMDVQYAEAIDNHMRIKKD